MDQDQPDRLQKVAKLIRPRQQDVDKSKDEMEKTFLIEGDSTRFRDRRSDWRGNVSSLIKAWQDIAPTEPLKPSPRRGPSAP